MKQKLFSLWLLLSVAVGLSAFEVDGLYYKITDQDSNIVAVTGRADNNLTTADIPKAVTFYYREYRVTSIGKGAFSGCTGLTSVTIPNSVTSIEGWAFYSCTGLTSITIPESVTSIEMGVFGGCNSLTSVTWNAKACSDFYNKSNTPFCCNVGNDDFKSDIRSQITSFTFGDSVQHIPAYLCEQMTNLTSVTIPNSVTSIGGQAFSGCTGLTSVTIGNSVTSIEKSVFRGCNSLTSVTWNAKACSDFYNERNTPFYYYTTNDDNKYLKFDIRSQITSFTFGDSVQHIPAYLCEQMTNLTSVTIGNSVTSIGNEAFWGCIGLTSVTIGNSVTSIGSYAFSRCRSLTSVTIPNSVTSIGSCAFSSCKNVETVVFGSSVETIGEEAFFGCQSIYEMTIYATKVPTIQENTFAGVGTGATLRVPEGCAKKYKAHPYWGVFNIEEIPSEYTITVTCDPKQGQVTGGGTYTDGSKVSLTATPNNGYEFKQWSDGSTANPYSFLVEKDMTIEALFEPTTPIENVVSEENNAPHKVFRDGQVYILRGGKTYTLTGVEVNL